MIVVAADVDEVATIVKRLDQLDAVGAGTVRVVERGDRRRLVLVSVDDDGEAARLVHAFREDGTIAVSRPDDGPRLDAWIGHTRPVTFGERLSVCFAFSEHDRSDLPGLIELGLGGFGNGSHPTTGLLVEQMIDRLRGGERVLDLGCGSGVLGLGALGLGAERVVAVDVKPEAVDAARRNAALNGMDQRMEATLAPLSAIEGTFDVIVANIGRAAIVELAPDLVRLLAPGGWLAVSGISPRQNELVAGFLRPLLETERRTSGEWSALVLAHHAHDDPRA